PVVAARKNFSLRTGCWVRRVVHKDGKAEGVAYMDASGVEMEQPARIVILASWTMNNSRLLMLSRVGEMYDATTGKGALGRNLTQQVSQSSPIFLDRQVYGYMGAGGLGATVADFDGERGLEAGVLRGGLIRMSSGGDTPIASFGRMPAGEAK